MSWFDYVKRTAGTDSPSAIKAKTGLDASHVSKWKAGAQPGPQVARQFARGYGRPVLEAFVAAEFLTAEDAKARPRLAPDYSQLTNDELLELVRARMTEGSGEHGRSAATTEAGSGRLHVVDPPTDEAAAHEDEADRPGDPDPE